MVIYDFKDLVSIKRFTFKGYVSPKPMVEGQKY